MPYSTAVESSTKTVSERTGDGSNAAKQHALHTSARRMAHRIFAGATNITNKIIIR
jgi:hypothetical protein